MSDSFEGITEDVLAVMRRIMMIRKNEMETAMRGRHGVIHVLHHMGPQSAATLSKLMNVSSARMTAMLCQMQEAGYVERTQDVRDKRVYLNTLTQKGIDKAHEQARYMRARTKVTLERMGEKDARELVRLLDQVATIMESLASTTQEEE